MMEHDEAFELLPAYLDQELGVAEAMAMERHVSGCAQCQAELAEQKAASAGLRRAGTYYRAPAGLAARIDAGLRQSRAPDRSLAARFFERLRAALGTGAGAAAWTRLGAVAASVLMLLWSAGLYLSLPSEQDRLAQELVASHVRSLQVEHLSDVASSDKHTVKPWFNGKLDFSPPVIDLTAQEFALEGGRLDYVDGRSVAVLVYRHRKHPINLYIWPVAQADASPQAQDRLGYHLVSWTAGGMKFWVVSDLALAELEDFVTMIRSKA